MLWKIQITKKIILLRRFKRRRKEIIILFILRLHAKINQIILEVLLFFRKELSDTTIKSIQIKSRHFWNWKRWKIFSDRRYILYWNIKYSKYIDANAALKYCTLYFYNINIIIQILVYVFIAEILFLFILYKLSIYSF